MNKFIYLVLGFNLFIAFAYSQQKDSLIQLYPGMGDTLDFIDREMFDLYPDIKGFWNAQLFLKDKKYFISNINYLKDGLFVDTVVIEDISRFSALQYELIKFKLENDKRFESPLDASIFTATGSQYEGKLKMFSKTFLYLNSDQNYLTNSSSPFRFKTPITKVDSLSISVKKNMFPYVGGGALVGFLGGFFIGTATAETDWPFKKEVTWFITGGIGLATGALIGWLIGESLPNDYITICFNSPRDVTKLKDYSAYYFQYDKSLEEKYVELEK